MKVNLGIVDRWIRLFLGGTLFVFGYFWTIGIITILLWILAGALIVTAFIGYCSLYPFFQLNTCTVKVRKKQKILFAVLLIPVLLWIESSVSIRMTEKRFMVDLQNVNDAYYNFLIATKQNDEAIAGEAYSILIDTYKQYEKKYRTYRPYSIRNDKKFVQDTQNVREIFVGAKDSISSSGSYETIRTDLEPVRALWRELLKRNNFPPLDGLFLDLAGVVGFMIDASQKKDSAEVVRRYQRADEIMKSIEKLDSSDDIATFRKTLDLVFGLAKQEKLEELGKSYPLLLNDFQKISP